MAERSQFTFYASFAAALRRLKKKTERCDAYDAIINYALFGAEPDEAGLPDAVMIAFELIRPNLDASRKKAVSGRLGGLAGERSKAEANAKQSASKNEKEKEIENEKEKEIENETEIETETETEIETEIETERETEGERETEPEGESHPSFPKAPSAAAVFHSGRGGRSGRGDIRAGP